MPSHKCLEAPWLAEMLSRVLRAERPARLIKLRSERQARVRLLFKPRLGMPEVFLVLAQPGALLKETQMNFLLGCLLLALFGNAVAAAPCSV